MRRDQIVFPYVLLGLALVFLGLSLGIAPLSELTLTSDASYPIFISLLSILFAAWSVAESRKKQAAAGETKGEEKPEEEAEPPVLNRDILVLLGLLLLYGAAVLILHYVLATLLFTFLAVTYLERRAKMGLLVGFIATFWIVLIFKYGFNVILP